MYVLVLGPKSSHLCLQVLHPRSLIPANYLLPPPLGEDLLTAMNLVSVPPRSPSLDASLPPNRHGRDPKQLIFLFSYKTNLSIILSDIIIISIIFIIIWL